MGYAQDCYTMRRTRGLEFYERGEYKEAMRHFNGANKCPDKPLNNDLDSLIYECQRAIKQKTGNLKQKLQEELEKVARKKDSALASRGYMKIQKVEITNVDELGNTINHYGSPIYTNMIKKFQFRITYNGLSQEQHQIRLDCKLYTPDNGLFKWDSLPSEYTYSFYPNIYPKQKEVLELVPIGSYTKMTFRPGKYTLEFWCMGNKLYSAILVLYNGLDNNLSKKEWKPVLEKVLKSPTYNEKSFFYKGSLKNSNRHGLGIGSWSNGVKYIGEWNSGDIEGFGIFFGHIKSSNSSDAVFYVGNYEKGMRTGSGRCYDRYGNLIYNGSFSSTEPISTYSSQQEEMFQFVCRKYKNGDMYLGETKNGKRNGYGIYLWASGIAWYGPWNNDKRAGKGLSLYPEGGVEEGTFYDK